jgi:Ferritin-like
MDQPELTWTRHVLDVPEDSPLRSIAIGLPGAADAETGRVEIQLPSFKGLPTPEGKIKLLLDKAAEVEHALMVQYLYSLYSLKPTSADPDEQKDLAAWQGSIREVAKEEMAHLMSVENLRLLLGLEPTFVRDDFPMVQYLFPFPFDLHALDQRILAQYIVAESPVGAAGIEDIIKLAMGGAGPAINRVGVLYGLIGVLLARDLGEIEQAAKGGDFWDVFVRDIAYVAYMQEPPSDHWHLLDSAFQAGSVSRQGTQDDWAPGNPDIRIHTVKDRQDARAAIKDIGVQGEGPGEVPGVLSHYQRFLAIYRGQPGMTRPFPDRQWVPTLDVPTRPKVTADPTEPGAISNPATQPWARLANLRYAILLGFLEEYLEKDPVADRAFLKGAALREMTVNLRRLSVKLVGLPRSAAGTGVAALPFELPPDGFPLPDNPQARKAVHARRLQQAIALEGQIIQAGGAASDPILSPMQTADQQNLTHFSVASTTMPTPTPTQTSPAPAPTTHWPQVKKILDDLIANWAALNGPPDLTGKHSDPHFGWATKAQLIASKPFGQYQLIEPGVAGKDTNLVKALRDPTGVANKGQMPYGGPYLTDDPQGAEKIKTIITWIDEGTPD